MSRPNRVAYYTTDGLNDAPFFSYSFIETTLDFILYKYRKYFANVDRFIINEVQPTKFLIPDRMGYSGIHYYNNHSVYKEGKRERGEACQSVFVMMIILCCKQASKQSSPVSQG